MSQPNKGPKSCEAFAAEGAHHVDRTAPHTCGSCACWYTSSFSWTYQVAVEVVVVVVVLVVSHQSTHEFGV